MYKSIFLVIAIISNIFANDYDTYVFHNLPNKKEFHYIIDNSKSSKDLEYEYYKNKLKEKLITINYIEDNNNPEVIIEFFYGVLGESREVETSVKVFSFFGATETNTLAKKYLNLNMYDRNTKQMIYQSKTISEQADEDDMFEVYDDMLKELFNNFPGTSGTKR